MKIALYNLTTTTKLGGVESIVWDVAQKLAERGHAVTLFGGRGKVQRQPPNVMRSPTACRRCASR